MTSRLLHGSLKTVLASSITLILTLSLTPLTHANSDPNKFVFRGGHLDAFYVSNNPNEVTEKNGQYESKINLLVKEDVTGSGIKHRPEDIKLVTTHKSYTCLNPQQIETFTPIAPDIKGAYFSNNTTLPTSEIMAPGYGHYVAFPDPEDPEEPYVTSDVKLIFSNVTGPQNGTLAPYSLDLNGKLHPELDNNQFALTDGAQWTFSSDHHHSLWIATKAGTYTFTAQAIVNIDEGPYENLEFKSEPATYTWEFEKSPNQENSKCTADPTPSTPDSTATPPTQNENSSEKPDNAAEENLNTSVDQEKNPQTAPEKQFPAQSDNPVSLDNGHADIFNVIAAGDNLRLNIKEDITGSGVLRSPESTELVVKQSAFNENLPQNFNPNLMKSGYYLPQSQGNGLLWPGWETLGVRPNFEAININFLSVNGPGRVQLAMQGGLGGSISQLKDGTIDLHNGSVIPVPNPTHVHTNWFFEKNGTYTMTVNATGISLTTGKKITSNTATYTWQVGDTDADAEKEQRKENKKDQGEVHIDTNLKAKNGTALVIAGTNTTFSASGFNPGESVKVTVHSNPVVVAPAAIANEKGELKVQWKIPTDFPAGEHKVIMQGKRHVMSTTFTVAKDTQDAEEKEAEKTPEQQTTDGAKQTETHNNGLPQFSVFSKPLAAQACIPTKVEVEISAAEAKKATAKPASTSTHTQLGASVTIPANTHVHPNWVFTAPGKYQVGITQRATLKNGQNISTQGILNFSVGGAGNANSGHFDVGAQLKNGHLVMAIKDDRTQPANWVSPSSLNFGLSNAAKAIAPAGMEFIAESGTPVWIISSAQVSGVPWVGANTQDPSFLAETTGSLTWTLDSVTGPGALAVFTSGNLGQLVGQKWFGGKSASGSVNTAKMSSKVSGQTLANGVTMRDGKYYMTKIVGKTASGAECILPSSADGHVLANTGTHSQTLSTAALLLLMCGFILLTVASKLKSTNTFQPRPCFNNTVR